MKYKVIGLMSGSASDGLDIVYSHINESAGNFNYEIINCECIEYDPNTKKELKQAVHLSAFEFLKLNAKYGKYIGGQVLNFIHQNNLDYKVDFIVSHGHTIFHQPDLGFSAQIGCGANISAITKLPVIDNLRNIDIANGGQGAPIIPIGDKLFFANYHFLLNIGGITNITHQNSKVAFDIAPANSVLNFLANKLGQDFDDNGELAKTGTVNNIILEKIKTLPYFKQKYPKSLSNQFAIKYILPLLAEENINNALATYCEFLSEEIKTQINLFSPEEGNKLIITGGGAFNHFLVEKIKNKLKQIEVVVPDDKLVKYKEALVMCLIGVLRWRLECNVLSQSTGAKNHNVNGSIWFSSELEN